MSRRSIHCAAPVGNRLAGCPVVAPVDSLCRARRQPSRGPCRCRAGRFIVPRPSATGWRTGGCRAGRLIVPRPSATVPRTVPLSRRSIHCAAPVGNRLPGCPVVAPVGSLCRARRQPAGGPCGCRAGRLIVSRPSATGWRTGGCRAGRKLLISCGGTGWIGGTSSLGCGCRSGWRSCLRRCSVDCRRRRGNSRPPNSPWP